MFLIKEARFASPARKQLFLKNLAPALGFECSTTQNI
jgi:hypothetical protein